MNECRSYWAFEHSGLNFDQRLDSVYVHSSERPYFYRTPDKLCFPLEYLFFTQCIRNQHFQFFYFKLKAWECRSVFIPVCKSSFARVSCPRLRFEDMQVHVEARGLTGTGSVCVWCDF